MISNISMDSWVTEPRMPSLIRNSPLTAYSHYSVNYIFKPGLPYKGYTPVVYIDLLQDQQITLSNLAQNGYCLQ